MKTIRYLILAIAVAGPGVCRPVLGEPADANQPKAKDEIRRNSPPRDEHWRDKSASLERFGTLERSSKLVGAAVKDSSGEKFGKIKDLAVDLESGRVLEVILSTGGVLGVGDKLTAMPPSMVMVDGTGNVSVNVDKEKVKSAPEFEFEKWSDATTPGRMHATYRYYTVEPRYLPPENYAYKTTPERTVTSTIVEHGTHWGKAERASKIVGQQVTNDAGEKVGKVDDLLVDLAAGRVTEVIVSSGGFLGVGDELSGIPPSVFRYDIENGKLALHANRDQLTAAPRFKSDEYARHSTPESVGAVYKAYGVTPYFDPSTPADNTARNIRDRNNNNVTPIDQGNNEGDIKVTADIRRSLTRESNLSLNARNVKIITVNGRVTLRGPVNTAAEKDRIEEIAHRVAGVDMVDSQIEVRGTEPENK